LYLNAQSVPVHEDNRRRQLLRELHSLYNVGNAMLGSGMPPRRRAEIAHSLGDIDEIRALGGFDDVDGAGDMGVGPEQVEKYDDDDALNTSFDSHETMPATPPRWRRHEPTAVIIPKIVPGTVAVAPETTIRMPPLRPVKQNSHTGDSARKRADEPREQRHSETRERCAHIVSIYDAFTDPESGSVCLVLEFMNAGSLQVRLFQIGHNFTIL
jgi:serine/threonine protein kinase